MLYTRKGDDGTTKTFGCNQRISKSSAIAEALGTLDETNSFLGLCRAMCGEEKDLRFMIQDLRFEEIILGVQQNLFIIQAELAGAEGKTIAEDKVKQVERLIDTAEKEMPPIKSFFIPGETEMGAMFDVARTISRRAERRVIAVVDEGKIKIGEHTKAYLNRLSSLLYALARLSNYRKGASEKAPLYK
jgi:cob(I)alamin adenosyltransferase